MGEGARSFFAIVGLMVVRDAKDKVGDYPCPLLESRAC